MLIFWILLTSPIFYPFLGTRKACFSRFLLDRQIQAGVSSASWTRSPLADPMIALESQREFRPFWEMHEDPIADSRSGLAVPDRTSVSQVALAAFSLIFPLP